MTAMRYTARKILTLLITMAVVSFLTFAAFDLISGDPATAMLGTQATPEKVAAHREEMGLNMPLIHISGLTRRTHITNAVFCL